VLHFCLHIGPDKPKLGTFNFRKVVQKHTEGYVGKSYMDFVENLLLFPAVNELGISIKN